MCQIGAYSANWKKSTTKVESAGVGQGGTLAAAGRRRLIRFSGDWGREGLGRGGEGRGRARWVQEVGKCSACSCRGHTRNRIIDSPDSPLLFFPPRFLHRLEARWGWGKPRNYGGIAYVRCVPDVVLYKLRIWSDLPTLSVYIIGG